MNFKRNGLPYSAITIIALISYATVVPLAHVAHLQTVHARSSDMRVVQLVTFEYLAGFLAGLLTLLFLGPAVYGAYAILCQNGTLGAECGLSTPLIQFSRHVVQWGIMSLLTVDCAAIVIALAMLFTPASFIKVGLFLSFLLSLNTVIQGSFSRSISFAFALTSLGMLVNTYSLTQIPTAWAWWKSTQGFAEEILATILSLLVTFFFSIATVSIAGACESLPEKESQSEPSMALSSK